MHLFRHNYGNQLIFRRSLRKFEDKGTKVTKLFAKHIKLQEAIDTCKKIKMNIGVGTPKRIIDLLDNGKSFVRISY